MADASITIRVGTRQDLGAAAQLLATVRRETFPAIPPSVHDDDVELEPFLCQLMEQGAVVFLAERARTLVGVLVLHGAVIAQLAVATNVQSQGIGRLLVEVALDSCDEPVTLWTFQSNVRAQGFYRHLGFREIARTNGENEEGEPDVCFQFEQVSGSGEGKGSVSSK